MPNLQMRSAQLLANTGFLWSRQQFCWRSVVSLEPRTSRRSLSVNCRRARLQNCEKNGLICLPTFTKPQTRTNQDASFSLNRAFTTIRSRPIRKRANPRDALFLPATKEPSLANPQVRQSDRGTDSVTKQNENIGFRSQLCHSAPSIFRRKSRRPCVTQKLLPNHPEAYYVEARHGWFAEATKRRDAILKDVREAVASDKSEDVMRFTMSKGPSAIEREAYYAGWGGCGVLARSRNDRARDCADPGKRHAPPRRRNN